MLRKLILGLFFPCAILIQTHVFSMDRLELSKYCTKLKLNDNTEISLYTPTMFRFRISFLKGEKFPLKYEIPFVVGKIKNWDPVKFKHWEDDTFECIETDSILIKVSKKSLEWTVWTKNDSKKIYPSNGPVYGLFRDGYTVFDSASAFKEKNHNSRYSHWFYDPETGSYADTYLAEDLIEDKYFIYGPDYARLFKQWNELVGPEPLLPKKAYGFFQTQHLACNGSQEKIFELAKQFREKDIPCDYFIIDFEWGDGCDGDKEVKWGSRLDWSSNYRQPLSPQQMIDSLHDMHYGVMLIHHSAPKFKNRVDQGWTESLYDEETWWQKFKEKLDLGIDGTWQDTRRNDITDSVIWKGMQAYLGPKQRVLFMGCRKMQSLNPWDNYFCALPMNQIIGARRYPFDWTGDCSYSWNELRWQIQAITNTHGSMKGITYVSSDAVGADWRIQARWNQFADFSTISRSHNPKPWSGNIDIKDFVNKIQITGRDSLSSNDEQKGREVTNRPTAENSIRKHRKLRYQLLPYIYSYAHINYQTGMPVCRPMLLAFAEDHRCNGNQWPFQYMFGESILVAPVYGDFNSMEIYLPDGSNWIDIWNKEVYAGGGILRYDVTDIEKLPVFIKSGAILPLRQELNWIDPDIPDDPLILDIYPDKDSSFTLYEDDGRSQDYQKGRYSKIRFECKEYPNGDTRFKINESEGNYLNKLSVRTYYLHINCINNPPVLVTQDNKKLEKRDDLEAIKNQRPGWLYDSDENRIVIKIRADLKNSTIIDIKLAY